MRKQLQSYNLNLLLHLNTLLNEKQVSSAAKKSGMSQPGMSHVLRELRKMLNDPILVKGKGGYMPTQKAQSLQNLLSYAFDMITAALAPETFDPYTTHQTFQVMMTDYASAIILPQLAHAFQHYPGLKINVLPWQNLETIAPNTYDCAIGFETGHLPKGFQAHTLFVEHYVCICHRDHPRLKDTLTLDAFLAEEHIIVREQNGAIGVVHQAFSKLGLGDLRKIKLEVPYFLAFPFVVSSTDWVVTTTSRNAALLASYLPLRILPHPMTLPTVSVSLFHHNIVDRSPAHQWFREQVNTHAQPKIA